MKQLLIVAIMCFSLFANAQVVTQQQQPVSWKFDVKKTSENNYTIYATAIIEKNWHVFTPEPGGDGFLIPTTIVLDASETIETDNKLKVESKIISKELLEGSGLVNFVEGVALFSVNVKTTAQPTKVKGILTYQTCNDKMCLPPTDVPFSIDLK